MFRKLTALFLCFALGTLMAPAGASAEGGSGLTRVSIPGDSEYTFLYGFTDENGTVKIPLVYDYAEPFSCGYALVRKGEKTYFIDEANRPAFGSDKSDYKFYYSFYEDRCVVSKNGKFGFLDKSGNVAIDLLYDDAYSFSSGLAAVSKDGKFGYIDKDGNTVIDFLYTTANTFRDGYAKVSKHGRYGFIDKTGGRGTPIIYETAADFSEGLSRVKINGKYTFVDQNGFFYFAPVFEEAYDFSGGMARVKINGNYGYLKKDGEFAIAPKYGYLSAYVGDYAIAGQYVADGVLWYGMLDKNGNRVLPFTYERIVYDEGQYSLLKNGYVTVLDAALQEVVVEETNESEGLQ